MSTIPLPGQPTVLDCTDVESTLETLARYLQETGESQVETVLHPITHDCSSLQTPLESKCNVAHWTSWRCVHTCAKSTQTWYRSNWTSFGHRTGQAFHYAHYAVWTEVTAAITLLLLQYELAAGPCGIPGYPGIPGLKLNPDPGILENKIPGFFGIYHIKQNNDFKDFY